MPAAFTTRTAKQGLAQIFPEAVNVCKSRCPECCQLLVEVGGKVWAGSWSDVWCACRGIASRSAQEARRWRRIVVILT